MNFKTITRFWLLSTLLISWNVSAEQVALNSLKVIGWVEVIALPQLGLQATAKIDSGADNSSLQAQDIVYFERDQQPWIRFNTLQNKVFESRLLKETKIKTKNGQAQSRPVIQLNICLAGEMKSIEVNLVNRAHFQYPLLIGRSALRGYLIDPSQTKLSQPNCP